MKVHDINEQKKTLKSKPTSKNVTNNEESDAVFSYLEDVEIVAGFYRGYIGTIKNYDKKTDTYTVDVPDINKRIEEIPAAQIERFVGIKKLVHKLTSLVFP